MSRQLRERMRSPLRAVAAIQPPVDDADWAAIFAQDPGQLWAAPVPVRITHRPPPPMTREQSRARRRINRVATRKNRWHRALQRKACPTRGAREMLRGPK